MARANLWLNTFADEQNFFIGKPLGLGVPGLVLNCCERDKNIIKSAEGQGQTVGISNKIMYGKITL